MQNAHQNNRHLEQQPGHPMAKEWPILFFLAAALMQVRSARKYTVSLRVSLLKRPMALPTGCLRLPPIRGRHLGHLWEKRGRGDEPWLLGHHSVFIFQ